MTLTRRQFLSLGATAASAGFYAWRVEPHWVQFVERRLPIRGLPKSLIGRTLVQISDVHTGLRVDDEYLVDVFRRVSDLNPDIVVLTGDLISHHADIFRQVEDVYRYFPQGRLATLGVLGNHDYGHGWREYDVADRVVATVAPLGLTILRNEVVDVHGLQIVGLDDLWSQRFAPQLVMPCLDPDRPSVVLSHNPDTADEPGGMGSRAGSSRVTRTAVSAGRRSCRRRCCRSAIAATPPASSRCRAIVACISIAASAIR